MLRTMWQDVFNVLVTKGSLPAQRLLTAVAQQRPTLLEPLSRELWMRVWNRVRSLLVFVKQTSAASVINDIINQDNI